MTSASSWLRLSALCRRVCSDRAIGIATTEPNACVSWACWPVSGVASGVFVVLVWFECILTLIVRPPVLLFVHGVLIHVNASVLPAASYPGDRVAEPGAALPGAVDEQFQTEQAPAGAGGLQPLHV